nr:MAG TPA: hypothetical protein [Caudoviricetes sp.]
MAAKVAKNKPLQAIIKESRPITGGFSIVINQ